MRLRDIAASLDYVLLASALLLVLVGLAMLISATYSEQAISPLFIRQGFSLAVALGGFILMLKLPYNFWQRYSGVLYGIGIAGLVVVALVGQLIRGTISRLSFFGFQVQPSEFAKIALLAILATFLARHTRVRWSQVLLTAAIMAVPVVLVLSEPDFGMAALMLSLWAGLLLVIGVPWRILGTLGLIAAIVSVGAWHWLLLDYQKARIATFLDPTANPLTTGYNVTQSIIALGSGKVLGRGLGHGPQSQLKFLPERHTDFIFASIGEELGFVGIVVVVALYAVLLWRIILIARATRDPFGRLISIGIFFLLLTSFTVSAGMNMGLLPVTGIPLPLVSYGGSNLLATFILLGIVESVWVHGSFMQTRATDISTFT